MIAGAVGYAGFRSYGYVSSMLISSVINPIQLTNLARPVLKEITSQKLPMTNPMEPRTSRITPGLEPTTLKTFHKASKLETTLFLAQMQTL
jgi:hypothetical protein